jgi:hypothetical protein
MGALGSVFARGVKPPYVAVRNRLGKAMFAPGADLRTDELVSLDSLGLDAPERVGYKTAPWSMLPRILPRREVSPEDVFIDYGSGMGRVVYQAASRYQFKRVIGLELSEELNRIARANLDRNARLLHAGDVELITADVLSWVPPPDITVACFVNPFTGATFATAVQRLLDAVHGPLRIIYFNPIEHDALLATGRLKVVRRLRGWRPQHDWSRSNSAIMYKYAT